MKTSLVMSWLIALILIVVNSSVIRAQCPVVLQPTVQWEGDQLVIPGQEGSNRIQILERGFHIVSEVPFPQGSPGFPGTSGFLFEGSVWAYSHDEATVKEGPQVLDRLYRFVNGCWELVVSHQEKASLWGFHAILPLENGRFFVIRQAQLRTARGLEGPFYIMGSNERGQLQTIREADGGIPTAIFDAPGMSRAFQVIRTGDTFLLLDYLPGWIWIYSLKDGALRRLVRVYEDIDTHRLQRNDFSTVMVGAQPQEDGSVMLAVRPQSAALNDDFSRRVQLGLRDSVEIRTQDETPLRKDEFSAPRRSEEQLDWAWKQNPEIDWMTLDVATGSLRKVKPWPDSAPTRIGSMIEYITFRWLPGWDGRVEFAPLATLTEEAERRKAAKKSEEAQRSKKAPAPKAVKGIKSDHSITDMSMVKPTGANLDSKAPEP